MSAAADPRSRKVAVDVAVEDPAGLLRPGLFARVELDAGLVPHTYLIPDSAVVAAETGYQVFLAEGDVARATGS